MRQILILLSYLLLTSTLFGQSTEKPCYISVNASDELNQTLLSNISISIISQYYKEIKPFPPGGLSGTDNCIYDVSVSKEGGKTFVTLQGKDMNSFGDSNFVGIDGFQQSLLKSLYRSLSDKRKLICEGYGELIVKCGSVVVQDVPKKVEPKVVEKKVTIPKVEPKVVVIPKKVEEHVVQKTEGDKTVCEKVCEGLVGYFPFNGDVKDYSGSGLDTLNRGGIFTTDKNGKQNRAMYFNGNALVTITNDNRLNFTDKFSISVWIKPVINVAGAVVAKWYQNGTHWSYVLYSGGSDQYGYGFRLNNGRQNFIETKNYFPKLNKWSLLTATFSNPNAKVYIDKKLVSQQYGFGRLTKDNNPVWIGKDGYNVGFLGELDEVRIYNRELTISEIEEIYNYLK